MSTVPTEAIVSALEDFERAPGRYAVALRKPQVVFDNLATVLRLAAGRPLADWNPDEVAEQVARTSARFFVRMAMLRPGSDHFTLLGLVPGFEASELRDHYRMMIKLTHPDFTASGESWPAEAAARINIANDVLSSPVEREAYRAQLQAARNVARESIKSVHEGASARRPPVRPEERTKGMPGAPAGAWSPRAKAMALGGTAVFGVVALLMLNTGSDDRSLSVRPPDASVVPPAALKVAETLGSADAGKPASPAGTVDATRPIEITSGNSSSGFPAPPSPAAAMASSPLDLKVDASLDSNRASRRTTSVSGAGARDAQTPPKPALDPDPAGAQRTAALEPRDGKAPAPPAKAPDSEAPKGQQVAGNAMPKATSPARAPSAPTDTSQATSDAPAGAWAQGVAAARGSSDAAVSVAAEASTPARPSAPAFGLKEVEPVMKQVVSKLQTGRGRNVVPLLAPESRNSPAVNDFVHSFQDELSGMRILEVKRTDLRSSEQSDKLVVDAVVEFVIEDYPGSSALKTISIQALFANRGGEPVLTQLTHLARRRGVR